MAFLLLNQFLTLLLHICCFILVVCEKFVAHTTGQDALKEAPSLGMPFKKVRSILVFLRGQVGGDMNYENGEKTISVLPIPISLFPLGDYLF